MRSVLGFVLIAALLAFGWVYAAGRGDPCAARRALIAAQSGPVMDKLSAKYPLTVGFGRALLNREGQFDDFVEQAVAETVAGADEDEPPGALECVYEYYTIAINQRRVQDRAVRDIEQAFGLAGE